MSRFYELSTIPKATKLISACTLDMVVEVCFFDRQCTIQSLYFIRISLVEFLSLSPVYLALIKLTKPVWLLPLYKHSRIVTTTCRYRSIHITPTQWANNWFPAYLSSFPVANLMSGEKIVATYWRLWIVSLYWSWLVSGFSGNSWRRVFFSKGMDTDFEFSIPNRSKMFWMYAIWLMCTNPDLSIFFTMKKSRYPRVFFLKRCLNHFSISPSSSLKRTPSSYYASTGFLAVW